MIGGESVWCVFGHLSPQGRQQLALQRGEKSGKFLATYVRVSGVKFYSFGSNSLKY